MKEMENEIGDMSQEDEDKKRKLDFLKKLMSGEYSTANKIRPGYDPDVDRRVAAANDPEFENKLYKKQLNNLDFGSHKSSTPVGKAYSNLTLDKHLSKALEGVDSKNVDPWRKQELAVGLAQKLTNGIPNPSKIKELQNLSWPELVNKAHLAATGQPASSNPDEAMSSLKKHLSNSYQTNANVLNEYTNSNLKQASKDLNPEHYQDIVNEAEAARNNYFPSLSTNFRQPQSSADAYVMPKDMEKTIQKSLDKSHKVHQDFKKKMDAEDTYNPDPEVQKIMDSMAAKAKHRREEFVTPSTEEDKYDASELQSFVDDLLKKNKERFKPIPEVKPQEAPNVEEDYKFSPENPSSEIEPSAFKKAQMIYQLAKGMSGNNEPNPQLINQLSGMPFEELMKMSSVKKQNIS